MAGEMNEEKSIEGTRRNYYHLMQQSQSIYVWPELYMIGYRKGKIILKFPPFFRLNEEYQEWEIQNQMKAKTKMLLFMFSFDVLNFPALDFPRSI